MSSRLRPFALALTAFLTPLVISGCKGGEETADAAATNAPAAAPASSNPKSDVKVGTADATMNPAVNPDAVVGSRSK